MAAAAEHVGFPAVIKPVSGAASIGVMRVDNVKQLSDAYTRWVYVGGWVRVRVCVRVCVCVCVCVCACVCAASIGVMRVDNMKQLLDAYTRWVCGCGCACSCGCLLCVRVGVQHPLV